MTKLIDKKHEDSVLKSADSVVVVTDGMKREFKDRSKLINVIYNGFDATDINIPSEIKSDKFVLSYVGNFKPNQNIHTLWDAVDELIKENKINKDDLKIEFTGNVDDEIISYIKTKDYNGNLLINQFQ